ncbi:MAG: hypothetical protein HC895_16150 [Leptolyngbyaceae cyanobacterium SM1_3_5]|nr:hypothetical protein [Leptolyngbyaceae cyanobacterium SM1_3_5]
MNRSAKLAGFVGAIGILGVLPFIVLSQTSFLRPQESQTDIPVITTEDHTELKQQIAQSTELNLRVSLSQRKVGLYRASLMKLTRSRSGRKAGKRQPERLK